MERRKTSQFINVAHNRANSLDINHSKELSTIYYRSWHLKIVYLFSVKNDVVPSHSTVHIASQRPRALSGIHACLVSVYLLFIENFIIYNEHKLCIPYGVNIQVFEDTITWLCEVKWKIKLPEGY